VFWTETVVQ